MTKTKGGCRAELGHLGEEIAVRSLCRKGYLILARNWRSGRNELDIVARQGPVVVFVEVKARRPGPQPAAQALTPRQRRRLARAARDWIGAHPLEGIEYRFDVVAVTVLPGKSPSVEHIPDAFHADGT